VSGVGDDGEIRIVELPAHRFFVATLFLPQTRSAAGRPHPLLAAFAAAVAAPAVA
jgi:CTP synthase (UTP-ammonia lyase)